MSLDEQRWNGYDQLVRFDCGCEFLNGGAVTLCDRAEVRNGILEHSDDIALQRARERARLSVLDLTAKDKNFLRGLKIGF